MKRKVSLVGPATLSVSLPSKWAKANNIKKGDEVEVTEEGNSLIIATEGVLSRKDLVSIEIPSNSYLTRRLIINPYIAGCDLVKVHFKERTHLAWIQECVSLLPGFEIIEQKEDYCIIKNLSECAEENLNDVFNRMFSMVIYLGEGIRESLSKYEWDELSEIIKIEWQTNRINYLIKRILNLKPLASISFKGSLHQWSALELYKLSSYLEEISDIYRDIGLTIKSKKIKLKEKSIIWLKNTTIFLGLYRKYFLNPSSELLLELKKKELELEQNLAELMISSSKEEQIINGYFVALLFRLRHLTI